MIGPELSERPIRVMNFYKNMCKRQLKTILGTVYPVKLIDFRLRKLDPIIFFG